MKLIDCLRFCSNIHQELEILLEIVLFLTSYCTINCLGPNYNFYCFKMFFCSYQFDVKKCTTGSFVCARNEKGWDTWTTRNPIPRQNRPSSLAQDLQTANPRGSSIHFLLINGAPRLPNWQNRNVNVQRESGDFFQISRDRFARYLRNLWPLKRYRRHLARGPSADSFRSHFMFSWYTFKISDNRILVRDGNGTSFHLSILRDAQKLGISNRSYTC